MLSTSLMAVGFMLSAVACFAVVIGVYMLAGKLGDKFSQALSAQAKQ